MGLIRILVYKLRRIYLIIIQGLYNLFFNKKDIRIPRELAYKISTYSQNVDAYKLKGIYAPCDNLLKKRKYKDASFKVKLLRGIMYKNNPEMKGRDRSNIFEIGRILKRFNQGDITISFSQARVYIYKLEISDRIRSRKYRNPELSSVYIYENIKRITKNII